VHHVDDPLRGVAERYVKLVLAVGQHDTGYVDAYYGPGEWRVDAEARPATVGALDIEAVAIAQALASTAVTAQEAADQQLWTLRREYLARQLAAVRARLAMLGGAALSFDEESLALYDAQAPSHTEAEFASVVSALEARLPDEGMLVERYDRFKSAFVIPAARLDRVFSEAIEAGRARTRPHVDLPAEECFTVEYVTGQPWSGYNWYQGGYRSLIQVNVDLPVYIDRAVDLACHEGYPGHHVYNVLLEQHLVRGRGWVEFSVYPLFSPQSLMAEGTANYGIEMAFPPADRLAFERDVLFPLAGLDGARAEEYYEVLALTARLSYAGNEAARRYLDGRLDRAGAVAWLEHYAMTPRPRAEQRLRFIDHYRSYVINYNLGTDLVRAYVERTAGPQATPAERWRVFAALLMSPRLPSGMR
jgi:hypothetical protein